MYRRRITRYWWVMALGCFALFCFLPFSVGAENRTINKPLQPSRQIQPLTFSVLDHGEVELSPPSISLQYRAERPEVLTLRQGEEGFIQIPETSADSQGRASVTIQFTLRNKTAKRFRFSVDLLHGNRTVGSTQVVLFGNGSKTIIQTVAFQPTSGYERFRIAGPVGVTDDTAIIFFSVDLWVRVFPV